MRGCLPNDTLLPDRPVEERLLADEVGWPPEGLVLSRDSARGGGGELALPCVTAVAGGSLFPALLLPERTRGSMGKALGEPSATSLALMLL